MKLELLVLKFDGTHSAGNALARVRGSSSDTPWLAEVAVVERHNSGRVSVAGTLAGYHPEAEEGAEVTGGITFGALTGSVVGLIGGPAGVVVGLVGGGLLGGAAGSAMKDENRELFFERVKAELPKGSSALLLLAAAPVLDEMVVAFSGYRHEEIRGHLTDEELAALRATTSTGYSS